MVKGEEWKKNQVLPTNIGDPVREDSPLPCPTLRAWKDDPVGVRFRSILGIECVHTCGVQRLTVIHQWHSHARFINRESGIVLDDKDLERHSYLIQILPSNARVHWGRSFARRLLPYDLCIGRSHSFTSQSSYQQAHVNQDLCRSDYDKSSPHAYIVINDQSMIVRYIDIQFQQSFSHHHVEQIINSNASTLKFQKSVNGFGSS